MDGDGRSSKQTHQISRSRLTTRKTVWVVTFRLSRATGCTCKVIRSSNRNNHSSLVETHLEKCFKRRIAMQKHLLAIIIGVGLTGSVMYLLVANPVVAAQSEQSSAVFDSAGKLKLPDPPTFRRWV